MRNLFLSEYEAEIAIVASRCGADKGSDVRRVPYWTAPLGGCGVMLDLHHTGRANERHLKPVVSLGSSSGLPSDPGSALVILRDSEATITRAMSALISLGSVRVWLDGCPCDFCSGTGGNRGSKDCKRCSGTGKRSEVAK